MDILQLRSELGHGGIPNNGNFYAQQQIQKNPHKLALKYPIINASGIEYVDLTFDQFAKEALRFAHGLNAAGFKQGDRIILLFPVSIDLYQLIYACFHLGVIPVFIDISMGTKKLLQGIRDSNAKGIISVDALLKYKYFMPSMWMKKCYSLDKKRFLIKKLDILKSADSHSDTQLQLEPKSSALITFTSGSTGRPKGANRTIEVLLNQKIVSEYMWPHSENEIDMPAFPMIVLQNLGCGVTSVLPAIDFQNYLSMDPKLVIRQMQEQKITRFSAQPFFIERICDELIKSDVTISSIKSLVVGGAIVSRKLCLKIKEAFPKVDANIVYGSTEAEPIAHATILDFLNSKGRGLLLGKVVPTLSVKIIKVSDDAKVSDELPLGEVGEIILSGPHVIKEYIDEHIANKQLKLKGEDNQIWHKTGDMGFFDKDKNLWLVGRVKDRITDNKGVLIPCYDIEEDILNQFDVIKVAFIEKLRTLYIEGDFEYSLVQEYLKSIKLEHFKIQSINKIPVDKRHFSRVDRNALTHLSG